MKNTIDIEIKKGINLHIVKTNKFKTNLLSVFLSTPLNKEKITINAMIPAILKRGSSNLKSQDEISIALEEMYGASFDCGIDKIGENQVLKFYIELLNNEYLPEGEDILKLGIRTILDIIFNPLIINGAFSIEYLESEKKNLKQLIEGRKDSKATYAADRCIEEMYKNEPYSLYKYGSVEDLENINANNLYEEYCNLINNCKIDIFISGDVDEDIKEEIIQNENIKNIKAHEAIYVINNKENRKKQPKEEKTVSEKMDINQGKLIIGLDILNEKDNDIYTALIYNAILGGTPTSKLFQNVREKNSLAYTASSSFMKQKANILMKFGIDTENFEKALKIIKEQLEDMKNGNFEDKNIKEAKSTIISSINFIPDEQDTEITYKFSQELSGYELSYEKYIEKVKKVTKEDIVNLANRIQVNTIYFLSNE